MNGKNTIDLIYNEFLTANETERITIYRDLANVFDYNAPEVEAIIKKIFLDKPFSKATLDKMIFYHENVIDKILNRKVAGLLSYDLKIQVIKNNKSYDLLEILYENNFMQLLFDLLKAMKFFNTILCYINVIDGKFFFERITGAECSVINKDNYLEIDTIYLFRADKNKNVFIIEWNDNYALKHSGSNSEPLFETEENPFNFIPIVILRDKIQNDFWGEPNWSLFYYQLFHILSTSDTIRGEFFQKFPILLGENININNLTIEPSTLISTEFITPDRKADLRFINPSVDWSNIRENDKFRYERLIINQNIPPESVSIRAIAQSGYAKTLDEIEFRELQEIDKIKLYSFLKEFVRKFLIINDYYKIYDLPSDGEIVVEFLPYKVYDDISVIKERRAMEKEFLIKDEIDFIMEDLGLSVEEAINHLKERLKRQDVLEEYKAKLTEEKSENIIDMLEKLASGE